MASQLLHVKISVALFVTFIVLHTVIVAAQQGQDLKCHVCNSVQDPSCNDPFNNITNPVKSCRQILSNDTNYGHLDDYWKVAGFTQETAPMFCRKIIQEVEDDKRTIRECAFLEDKKIMEREENERCIPRAGTYHIKYVTCYCEKNGCNGAPPALPKPSHTNDMLLLAASSLIALVLLK